MYTIAEISDYLRTYNMKKIQYLVMIKADEKAIALYDY